MLVAIVILTVGLLGLAAAGLHVSRLLAQGSRTSAATTFGTRRLELLRAAACQGSSLPDGTEVLRRGGSLIAANSWTSRVVADHQLAIRVVTRYVLDARRARSDTLEAVVVCP